MMMHVGKTTESKTPSGIHPVSDKSRADNAAFELTDNRPESKRATQLQEIANSNFTDKAPIQRVVIYAGAGDLDKEDLIIYSDIAVAMKLGGVDQDIITFKELKERKEKFGAGENIFLVGHGHAGKAVTEDPKDFAALIKPFLPKGYAGEIISLSCHTGEIKEDEKTSAVDVMSEELDIVVSGLKGPAYNDLSINNIKHRRVLNESLADAMRNVPSVLGAPGFPTEYVDQIAFLISNCGEGMTEELAKIILNDKKKYIQQEGYGNIVNGLFAEPKKQWSQDKTLEKKARHERAKAAAEITKDLYPPLIEKLDAIGVLFKEGEDTTVAIPKKDQVLNDK